MLVEKGLRDSNNTILSSEKQEARAVEIATESFFSVFIMDKQNLECQSVKYW